MPSCGRGKAGVTEQRIEGTRTALNLLVRSMSPSSSCFSGDLKSEGQRGGWPWPPQQRKLALLTVPARRDLNPTWPKSASSLPRDVRAPFRLRSVPDPAACHGA